MIYYFISSLFIITSTFFSIFNFNLNKLNASLISLSSSFFQQYVYNINETYIKKKELEQDVVKYFLSEFETYKYSIGVNFYYYDAYKQRYYGDKPKEVQIKLISSVIEGIKYENSINYKIN